jgi:hypothetical protein
MTILQLETLQDVIDEALDQFRGTKGNREIAAWMRENYPHIIQENVEMLSEEGLRAIIRSRRKGRPVLEDARSIHNLCLDFGLAAMELSTEISIPEDRTNPLGCAVEWKEPDDADIEEIEAHIVLLRATAAATVNKADNWALVVDVARRYQYPAERVCLGELRRRARENRADTAKI